MAVSTETQILFSIFIFLAVLGFFSVTAPAQFQVFGLFDFGFISASIIGVAGACVITTGLPCAVALVVFGIATFIQFFVLNFDVLRAILIVPIVLITTYIISRLARGGG